MNMYYIYCIHIILFRLSKLVTVHSLSCQPLFSTFTNLTCCVCTDFTWSLNLSNLKYSVCSIKLSYLTTFRLCNCLCVISFWWYFFLILVLVRFFLVYSLTISLKICIVCYSKNANSQILFVSYLCSRASNIQNSCLYPQNR